MKKLKYISIEKQKRKKFILGSVLGCATAGAIIAIPIYFLAHENKINRKKINQTNLEKEKNIFAEKMLSIIPFRNDQLHNKERYLNIFNNKDKYLGLIEEAQNQKELNKIFNEWKEQIDGYKKSTLNFVSTNSEIIGGNNGTIFQAENGDIYAMGKGSGIKVLKNNENEFQTINSDIKNGEHGVIFQARNGDIYAMANESKLQVLKIGDNIFRDAPGSIIGITTDGEGNQTSSGEGGVIFQARNGDIYAMSHGSVLEVLKNGEEKFKHASGSNIDDGERGVIFETQNGDIYAIGTGQKLQVLKKNETNFKDVKSDVEIRGGASIFANAGIIFESKNGDIYACGGLMGSLQILKKGEEKFKSATINKPDSSSGPMSMYHIPTILYAKSGDIYLTDVTQAGFYILEKNGSSFKNIESKISGAPVSMIKHSDGAMLDFMKNGVIFEDKNGDIYVAGPNSELQVLEHNSNKFHQSFKSNIQNGAGMKIFQAKNGDIYTMGNDSKLQVLKYGYEVFVNVPTEETIQGINGTIFQAKNGDIYAMGENSTLQVLKW